MSAAGHSEQLSRCCADRVAIWRRGCPTRGFRSLMAIQSRRIYRGRRPRIRLAVAGGATEEESVHIIATDRVEIGRGVKMPGLYVVISIHDPTRPPVRIAPDPLIRGVLKLAPRAAGC